MYAQINDIETYLKRLSQLFIDAAVSDNRFISGSVNDYSQTLNRTIDNYLYDVHGYVMDSDEVEQIRTCWDDNGYCDIIEALKIWVKFYDKATLFPNWYKVTVELI